MSARLTKNVDTIVSLPSKNQRLIRYFAAVMSGMTAFIYFLIGFHLVTVLDANADQTWGLLACVAYAVGAVLLFMSERRIVWILGALFQIFVIFTYFNVASQRTPDYEVWGIVLRVIQSMILIALAFLIYRTPSRA